MAGRVIAWGLFVLAFAAVCRDTAMLVWRGAYAPVSLADLWSLAEPDSLRKFEAAFGADSYPSLWRWLFSPVLESPLWLVLAVTGALAAFTIVRPRKRKWRSSALG
jgi:hypothetical protein